MEDGKSGDEDEDSMDSSEGGSEDFQDAFNDIQSVDSSHSQSRRMDFDVWLVCLSVGYVAVTLGIKLNSAEISPSKKNINDMWIH